MAIQIPFFMSPEDERELFRKLEPRGLDLYPELTTRAAQPLRVDATVAAALDGPGYYLAVGDVTAYVIKRGQNRGSWKIDEVASPVVYFARSLPDEDGQLRSGYFWAFVGPGAARLHQAGTPLREAGRKGELIVPFR
jgi:hypothetical protein